MSEDGEEICFKNKRPEHCSSFTQVIYGGIVLAGKAEGNHVAGDRHGDIYG